MSLPDQIVALRMFIRALRADINRASRDQNVNYLKRRVSPFVVNLRYHRLFSAYEVEEVAQECLNQLRKANALSIAEFFPGDLITLEVILKGLARRPERHIIKDVEWSKPNSYHYIAWQVTKEGNLFRAGPGWLCPSNLIRITRCDDTLPAETERQCKWFHEVAKEFVQRVTDRGSLDEIVKQVRERRSIRL
jgi:hypothetical protein